MRIRTDPVIFGPEDPLLFLFDPEPYPEKYEYIFFFISN